MLPNGLYCDTIVLSFIMIIFHIIIIIIIVIIMVIIIIIIIAINYYHHWIPSLVSFQSSITDQLKLLYF